MHTHIYHSLSEDRLERLGYKKTKTLLKQPRTLSEPPILLGYLQMVNHIKASFASWAISTSPKNNFLDIEDSKSTLKRTLYLKMLNKAIKSDKIFCLYLVKQK